MNPEQDNYLNKASLILGESGFYDKSLADLRLPEVQRFYKEAINTDIVFVEMGDTKAAKTVVFAPLPYSTKLDDPSILVRLAAQQAVLGDECAVVGVQVYEPRNQTLDRNERRAISKGSFLPFADRLLATVEHMQLTDEQEVALYGFSMGADVSVEASHATLTDVNRGVITVDRLGVFEPARVVNRGGIAVMAAFGASGKQWFDNIIAADTTALFEARGIDITDPKAKKKHDASVSSVVMRYVLGDVTGNIAIAKGFGHHFTMEQLNTMAKDYGVTMPQTLLVRMTDSKVTPYESMRYQYLVPRITAREYAGDHSIADNIRQSAAFVLRLVEP